jgi:hypothetical protein
MENRRKPVFLCEKKGYEIYNKGFIKKYIFTFPNKLIVFIHQNKT